MNSLSLSQSYLLCALNKKGRLPLGNFDILASIVTASIVELYLQNYITADDQTITAITQLNPEHQYLNATYDFINQNNGSKLQRLLSKYCSRPVSERIQTLSYDICASLEERQCVTAEVAGILRNWEVFVPDSAQCERMMGEIHAEVSAGETVSRDWCLLVKLLQDSNLLGKYLSSEEQTKFVDYYAQAEEMPQYCELIDLLQQTLTAMSLALRVHPSTYDIMCLTALRW